MSHLIVNGDCRRGLVDLARVDAVISDPPYGIGYVKGTGGRVVHVRRNSLEPIVGDRTAFDPSPWLGRPCLLWGANHWGSRIPRGGTWLAWDKVDGQEFGDSFADCEFAWCSRKSIKRNIFRYLWKGTCCVKIDEHNGRGGVDRHHPTQKPIALMRWCIRLMGLPPDSLILDPYMGSGTTLIAALAEGHRAIGIEVDPRYCAIARRRIERPHARPLRSSRDESLPLFP